MNIYEEQLEKFYQELENDPEFLEYMEQKRLEWIDAMEKYMTEMENLIEQGIDPFENSTNILPDEFDNVKEKI